MNRTKQFIGPLILTFDILKFVDCYLGINKLNDINGLIYIVSPNERISLQLEQHKNFNGKTIYKDQTIFILKLNNKYLKDYEQFILGNYSKISLNTKRKIYRYWMHNGIKSIENIVFNSLFNQEELKNILSQKYTNTQHDKELFFQKIKNITEVNSIPKLKDEIFFTTYN